MYRYKGFDLVICLDEWDGRKWGWIADALTAQNKQVILNVPPTIGAWYTTLYKDDNINIVSITGHYKGEEDNTQL